MNVQYGCGKCAPEDWINFDISPTLKLERIPLLGFLFTRAEWGAYPKNVKIGDIVKKLPGIKNESCDAVYCSHILEHLTYRDMLIAIKNTYEILKVGGVFRLVVPDTEVFINTYLYHKQAGEKNACDILMSDLLMGYRDSPKTLKEKVIRHFGNSKHLWNYDFDSLSIELENVGFTNIRRAQFNDSSNLDFLSVEDIGRFEYSLAIECIK